MSARDPLLEVLERSSLHAYDFARRLDEGQYRMGPYDGDDPDRLGELAHDRHIMIVLRSYGRLFDQAAKRIRELDAR